MAPADASPDASPDEPRHPPRNMRRDPRFVEAVLAITGLLVVALGAWYVNTPTPLPVAPNTIQAATPVDQPVYVGVFAPSAAFGRMLTLSGIKVSTTSNTELSVVPLLCRGGTLGVTTDPTRFCDELVNPEGERFGPGDDIVLEITGDRSAVAVIDRIRVGFREGLRWGTEEAGAPVVVRVLDR